MSKKNKQHKSEGAKLTKNYRAHAGSVIGLAIVGAIIYFVVTAPRVAISDLASETGLHYHPTLSIMVNNEPVLIPNNVGLDGAAHKPIHTHEEGGGMLHLEFDGKVKKTDTALGKFFDIWQKEWTTTSFMGYPIDATHTLTMKVDGEVSTEYRDLQMKDKQKIELIYQ